MITGNEPAQASLNYNQTTGHPNGSNPGLTIREHFASMAMQGCIASGFETTMKKHAESAVEAADALIAELNKKP